MYEYFPWYFCCRFLAPNPRAAAIATAVCTAQTRMKMRATVQASPFPRAPWAA